jgi:hypothetical protein
VITEQLPRDHRETTQRSPSNYPEITEKLPRDLTGGIALGYFEVTCWLLLMEGLISLGNIVATSFSCEMSTGASELSSMLTEMKKIESNIIHHLQQIGSNILKPVEAIHHDIQLIDHKINKLDQKMGSIQTLIESQVLNQGIQLEKGEMRQIIVENQFIRKILFIMKYVINTKKGVISMWPFKVRDQYVFVTNSDIIKYIATTLFKKDFTGESAKFACIVDQLFKAKIEVYTFQDFGSCLENQALAIFPLQPLKTKTPRKWFGINALHLANLFVSITGDQLPKTKISRKLMDWAITCRDEIRDDSQFPKWTSSSRPKIYSVDALRRTPNRIQWGVEMPVTLFSSECYEAITQLNNSVQRLSEDVFHIGTGWHLLGINELENYENVSATAAAADDGAPAPVKSRKRRPVDPDNVTSSRKRGKSQPQLDLSHVSEPVVSLLSSSVSALLQPPPITVDDNHN